MARRRRNSYAYTSGYTASSYEENVVQTSTAPKWYDLRGPYERLRGRLSALLPGLPYRLVLTPSIPTACCAMESKTIFINPLLGTVLINEQDQVLQRKMEYLLTRAMEGHEVLHAKFSDPAPFAECKKEFPALGVIWNILEDIRIESIGASLSFVDTQLFTFKAAVYRKTLPKITDLDFDDPNTLELLLLYVKNSKPAPEFTAKGKLKWLPIRRLVYKATYADTSEEVAVIAREIAKIAGLTAQTAQADPSQPDEMSGTQGKAQKNPMQKPDNMDDPYDDKDEEAQAMAAVSQQSQDSDNGDGKEEDQDSKGRSKKKKKKSKPKAEPDSEDTGAGDSEDEDSEEQGNQQDDQDESTGGSGDEEDPAEDNDTAGGSTGDDEESDEDDDSDTDSSGGDSDEEDNDLSDEDESDASDGNSSDDSGSDGDDASDLDSLEDPNDMGDGEAGGGSDDGDSDMGESDDDSSDGGDGIGGSDPDENPSAAPEPDQDDGANEDLKKLLQSIIDNLGEDVDNTIDQATKNLLAGHEESSHFYTLQPPLPYIAEAAPLVTQMLRELRVEQPRSSCGANRECGKFNSRYYIRSVEKPWKRKMFHGEESPKMALFLLLDLSGSMINDVHNLRVFAMAVYEVCRQLSIPLIIGAFDDNYEVIKQADEWSEAVTMRLAGLVHRDMTTLCPGLRDAYRQLFSRPETLKHVVVVHDGGPQDGINVIQANMQKLKTVANVFGIYIQREEIDEGVRENLDAIFGQKNYQVAPMQGVASSWCLYVKQQQRSKMCR